MSFITIIIVGILLVLITYYVAVRGIFPESGLKDVLPEMEPLSTKKDIVTPDEIQKKLLGSSGSTVMGFFKLKDGDRTAKYVDQYTPLLQVANNWFLDISPSPVGKDHTSARLRVQVKGNDGLNTELIELPSIPKQKWIFIAILRDGRRFDIIYDNQIVASHRLANYPVIISSPLSIGNNGIDGSVIHVIINDKRMTPNEVERERVRFVDTNNTIIEDNSIDISFPKFKFFAKCPSGLPCDTITKPPCDNLNQWSTPYS
jgi:hypothetical protein